VALINGILISPFDENANAPIRRRGATTRHGDDFVIAPFVKRHQPHLGMLPGA